MALGSAERRPEFVLWHSLGTHDPYNRDFESQIFGEWLPSGLGAWYNPDGSTPSVTSERLARRLYLAGAVEFDRQLGEILDRLSREGTYDSTLIVLNSDHGRSFTRTGDSRIGNSSEMMWNDVAHVPLLVKMPAQKQPEQVTEPRSTAQIARTILDAARVRVLDGPALAPELRSSLGEPPAFVVSLGRDQPESYQLPVDLVPNDSWVQRDLESVSSELPFAATDPDLEEADALGTGWTEFTPSEIQRVEGESSVQLWAFDVGSEQCSRSQRAAVTQDGRLVAQVTWNQTITAPKDGERGYVILPRRPDSDYAFWCETN